MDQETAKRRYGEAIAEILNRYSVILGLPEEAKTEDGIAILIRETKPKKQKNNKEE